MARTFTSTCPSRRTMGPVSFAIATSRPKGAWADMEKRCRTKFNVMRKVRYKYSCEEVGQKEESERKSKKIKEKGSFSSPLITAKCYSVNVSHLKAED